MCSPRYAKTRNFANFRMKIFHYGWIFGIFEKTLPFLVQFESGGYYPEVHLLIGAFVSLESTWLHVAPAKWGVAPTIR